MRWLAGLACTALAALLTGCSLPRMIDSDVQSFATDHPPASGSTYQFDRLLSQAGSSSQNQLEAMAEQALRNVGLHKGDAQAPYVVQVQLAIRQIPNPRWPQPHEPLLLFWRDRGRDSRNSPFLMRMPEPPWVRHSVQLLMRDASTAQVVYETNAVFDGPWYDSDNLVPVILNASLAGYPQAGAGMRKVVIELPGPPSNRENLP